MQSSLIWYIVGTGVNVETIFFRFVIYIKEPLQNHIAQDAYVHIEKCLIYLSSSRFVVKSRDNLQLFQPVQHFSNDAPVDARIMRVSEIIGGQNFRNAFHKNRDRCKRSIPQRAWDRARRGRSKQGSEYEISRNGVSALQ